MKKPTHILKVLPVGICALALTACGKSSNDQTFVVPEEKPKIDPKKFDARATSLRLADTAYTGGQYAMAAQLYYRAAELNPGSPELSVKLGFALFKAGAAAEAEKAFRTALSGNGKDQEAMRGLAHSLVVQGRAAEAVGIYRQALAANGNDVRIHAGLGAALDMVGKHQEARAVYEAGLKIAPADFGLRNNLALSYAMSGEADKAKSILNNLSQGDPALAPRANLSLATVRQMASAFAKPESRVRTLAEAPAMPAVKQAPGRDEPGSAADSREVADIRVSRPAPAPVSRKSHVDLATTDRGDDTIYITTGRAAARTPARAPAMSFSANADASDAAADEVIDLLQQAKRGPRFVWQEARRPDEG